MLLLLDKYFTLLRLEQEKSPVCELGSFPCSNRRVRKMREVWNLIKKLDVTLSYNEVRRAKSRRTTTGCLIYPESVGRVYYGRVVFAAVFVITGVVLTWPAG